LQDELTSPSDASIDRAGAGYVEGIAGGADAYFIA
jgi:hypothetical protein